MVARVCRTMCRCSSSMIAPASHLWYPSLKVAHTFCHSLSYLLLERRRYVYSCRLAAHTCFMRAHTRAHVQRAYAITHTHTHTSTRARVRSARVGRVHSCIRMQSHACPMLESILHYISILHLAMPRLRKLRPKSLATFYRVLSPSAS
jgi:hypothetical protein